jgi:hypothetical protein
MPVPGSCSGAGNISQKEGVGNWDLPKAAHEQLIEWAFSFSLLMQHPIKNKHN